MSINFLDQEQIDALTAVLERLDARGLDEESRALRQVLVTITGRPREVPASAAAQLLAVTSQTIRNWVRAGTLTGRRDATGHFFVRVDDLEPAMRMRQLMPDVADGTYADEELDAALERARARRRSHDISNG